MVSKVRKIVPVAGVAGILALGGVACGNDDDEAPADDNGAETTVTSGGTETTDMDDMDDMDDADDADDQN